MKSEEIASKELARAVDSGLLPSSVIYDETLRAQLNRFARACIAQGLEMGADNYSQMHVEYFGSEIAETLRDMAAEMRK